MVEGAVKEVLQALSRSVAAKNTIELDFGHIGRYMYMACIIHYLREMHISF